MPETETSETTSDAHARGIAMMREVYGWDMPDLPGHFYRYTVDHLFGDIWYRPGLSLRDRRLLLIGLMAGRGQHDTLKIQYTAAMGNGELDTAAVRETVIMLAHYAGWPTAAGIYPITEGIIAEHVKAQQAKTAAESDPEGA